MRCHQRPSRGAVFLISAFLFEEKGVFILASWVSKEVLFSFFCEALMDLFSGLLVFCFAPEGGKDEWLDRIKKDMLS